ncbi:MAG: glycoside hydrolase family 55 protein [Aphanothece sp. CMT-3BRIN-NPC111]|jgi:polygalacturonase|nr:glycoside hydrolase family 55 protein [Aphanothece sp. CMT-3BRIN-NPC111]
MKVIPVMVLLGSVVMLSSPTRAENIVFPADAGMINVKKAPYNAKGDGVTDDTAAIQQALNDNVNYKKPVYFPNGTYLISDNLTWGGSGKRLMLQGQSQAQTIIKLKNNATGFDDPNNRKFVISTFDGSTTAQAFYNYIFNLTVDIGSGNPGAVGINFINNNVGGIRDVTIRSSDLNKVGARGLLLTKPFPGPGLIRNLTVDGFDQGIRVGAQDYSMVFENITLMNQRQAGFVNQDNISSIRGMTSINTVPAIQNIGDWGLVTLIDGNLTGGSFTNVAIQNAAGEMYLRNINTSGYLAALNNKNIVIPELSLSEYVSETIYSLFPSPQGHLKLPILDTPDVKWDLSYNWVSVKLYGAKGDGITDDTAAIQAAMDSGKATIYFPFGSYKISNTIHVRGNVRRIMGLWSTINVVDPLKSSDLAAFRFEPGNQSTVVFERFQGAYLSDPVNFTFIEHASPNTLVIRNSGLSGKAYRNTPGAGKLFIEDVTGAPWIFNNQQVWARQINAEIVGTKIFNNGSTLWILGLKTEEVGTAIETRAGGKTEVLGGLLYPIDQVPTYQPAFLNDESSLSVSIGESAYGLNSRYATLIQENRGGVAQVFSDVGLPGRTTYGKIMPLYVGH